MACDACRPPNAVSPAASAGPSERAGFIEAPVPGRAIVGIEVRVAQMVGKWKVSQNRLPRDIDGMAVRTKFFDDYFIAHCIH